MTQKPPPKLHKVDRFGLLTGEYDDGQESVVIGKVGMPHIPKKPRTNKRYDFEGKGPLPLPSDPTLRAVVERPRQLREEVGRVKRKLKLLRGEALEPPKGSNPPKSKVTVESNADTEVHPADLGAGVGSPRFMDQAGITVMLDGEPVGRMVTHFREASRDVERVHTMGDTPRMLVGPSRQTITCHVQSAEVHWENLERAVRGTLAQMPGPPDDPDDMVLRHREVRTGTAPQHAPIHEMTFDALERFHGITGGEGDVIADLSQAIEQREVRGLSMGCQVEFTSCSICGQVQDQAPCEHLGGTPVDPERE